MATLAERTSEVIGSNCFLSPSQVLVFGQCMRRRRAAAKPIAIAGAINGFFFPRAAAPRGERSVRFFHFSGKKRKLRPLLFPRDSFRGQTGGKESRKWRLIARFGIPL